MKITYLCYSFFVAMAISITENTLTDAARWNLLQKKAQEVRAVRAFDLFRKHKIEPILIKGLSAGRFYPDDRPRMSIDMDLAVSAKDFDAASEIAASGDANGLAIDLHRELRHHDTAGWDDLFENSEILEFDTGSIRVLRPEDNLRVLCIHWLTDGGSNKDRLWDVFYSIQNRHTDFDWDRFLSVVSPNRRRWLICTVGLAHKYLGLDLTGTPVETDALDLPDWLTKTVEREWASKTKAIPLEVTLNDPKMFLTQAVKRLRPNPIWATVQMEGSFDAKTRVFYQIGNAVSRIIPSSKRITQTLRQNSK